MNAMGPNGSRPGANDTLAGQQSSSGTSSATPTLQVGRYYLAESLGSGPTGEVFRGRVFGVAGLERQYAVRCFHRELSQDPKVAAAIVEAARQYATLTHPRIARLHEHGTADGRIYAAVELVSGTSLAALLTSVREAAQPISPGAALVVASQVARALGHAHGRGILHLGVCPTNVVLTANGDAKLTDFGFLAALLASRSIDDRSLVGRLPYLAPEQLVGSATSERTDVLQLALVIGELLIGERLLDGVESRDYVDQLDRVVEVRWPVGDPVATVLRRALAREPRDRWNDAASFADALDAAIRKSPAPGGRIDTAGAVRRALTQLSGDTLTLQVPWVDRGEVTEPAGVFTVEQDDSQEAMPRTTSVAASAMPPPPPLPPPPRTTSQAPASSSLRPPLPPPWLSSLSPFSTPSSSESSSPPPPPLPPPPPPPHSSLSSLSSPEEGRRSSIGISSATATGDSAASNRSAADNEPGRESTPRRLPGVSRPLPSEAELRSHQAPFSAGRLAESGQSDPTEPGRLSLRPSQAPKAEESRPKGWKPAESGIQSVDSSFFASGSFEVAADLPPLPVDGRPEHVADDSTRKYVQVPENDALGEDDGTSQPEVSRTSAIEGRDQDGAADLEALDSEVPGADVPTQPSPPPPPPPPLVSVPTATPTSSSPRPPSPPSKSLLPSLAEPHRNLGGSASAENVSSAEGGVSASGIQHGVAGAGEGDPDLVETVQEGLRSRQLPVVDEALLQPRKAGRKLGRALGALGIVALAGGVFAVYHLVGSRDHRGEGKAGLADATEPASESEGRTEPAAREGGKNGRFPDGGQVTASARVADAVPRSASAHSSDSGGSAATIATTATVDSAQRTRADQPATKADPDSDRLLVESEPAGAMVYIDGALKGKTPLELPATGDSHKLALVMEGRKLHRAEIQGQGRISVTLAPAGKLSGPAGIKVRCRSRNRFYIIIDGVDTGLFCPTERIDTTLGEHTVEIYDPVSDVVTTHRLQVKQTHNSERVRVDEDE
ncbi:MAG: serine/threonine-protein kinase [Pseudomonadota bacterium]